MNSIIRYLIALLVSAILTGLTILIVGIINYVYVGEIPVFLTIIGTILNFILYSFVTCLIAYLTSKNN